MVRLSFPSLQSPIVRSFLLRYGIFLALLLFYDFVAARWLFDADWTQVLTEVPLLLYLYALLQEPLRKNRWRPVAAALPLIWIYLVHDYYLLVLGTVPNLLDFKLLPDLFLTFSPAFKIGSVALLALPVVGWLLAVDWKLPRFRWTALVLVLPAVLVFGAVFLFPEKTYEASNAVTEDEEWSDKATAEHWGRVYTVLMRQARRGGFLAEIGSFPSLEQSGLKLSDPLLASLDKRNVHIIVLESFIDVRLFREVKFSQPPLAEEFVAWSGDSISSSISSAFGGETARAEFEILCGVPSLRLYGIEFLAFSGAFSYCLPNILSQAGYLTQLTFPFGPVYFNSSKAYPGIGFQKMIFADRFVPAGEESIALGDQDYLFDSDLFAQNLVKVKALLGERRPFLNYVLTMYGHWPFEMDEQRHPIRIEVRPNENDLKLISNQMFYRSQALTAYVKALIDMDPKSIIVLVADHLPPLPEGERDYQRLGYQGRSSLGGTLSSYLQHENFLLVVVDGQAQRLPLMRHFDIPKWILDQLSNGAYCREKVCDFGRLPIDPKQYLDAYQTILGLAARPPT